MLDSHVQVHVSHQHFPTEEALINAVDDQDILVIMRERTAFNAAVLSKLPNLKLLVTTGMRNAAIDLTYAKLHGITVCGTNNLTTPTVEHTWALLLCLTRHIVQENNALQKEWSMAKYSGYRIKWKTIRCDRARKNWQSGCECW